MGILILMNKLYCLICNYSTITIGMLGLNVARMMQLVQIFDVNTSIRKGHYEFFGNEIVKADEML
jgi:hypothetical protein